MIVKSNQPVQKTEAVIFFLIGLASTIIPSVLFSVWDGLIVALILFCIGRLAFKKYDRLLFTFSYGLYLLNATFFLMILNWVNGNPFLAGGDDLFFYSAGKELFLAEYNIITEVDGIPLWVANYPFYLYLISFYYGFLSQLGLDSLHFYHLTLLKVAFGASIPVFIFNLARHYQKDITKVDLITIILFPALVLQTVSFLRDSIISFFFILGVLKAASNKRIISRLIWLLPLATIIYFIRPVHAFFLIIFLVIYIVFENRRFLWLKIFGVSALAVICLFFFNKEVTTFFEQYERVQGMYTELSLETNQEGSLGVKLYSSNAPMLIPIKLLYYFLSPIPPPIVSGLSGLSLYLSLGAIFWYFIIFGFLKSVMKQSSRENPFYVSLFVLFVLAGLVGISSSKDPRHLTFMYPIILPFGLKELNTMPKNQLYVICILSAIFGLLGYVLFKFVI